MKTSQTRVWKVDTSNEMEVGRNAEFSARIFEVHVDGVDEGSNPGLCDSISHKSRAGVCNTVHIGQPCCTL